jgi:hypothetical protein
VLLKDFPINLKPVSSSQPEETNDKKEKVNIKRAISRKEVAFL